MRPTLEATAAVLAELGSETRLAIVRLLVRAGEEGLTVGDIQRATGVPGSTLSHHLSRLRGVGVVTRTRSGSALQCRAELERIRATADFLIEECCADVKRPCPHDSAPPAGHRHSHGAAP